MYKEVAIKMKNNDQDRNLDNFKNNIDPIDRLNNPASTSSDKDKLL